MDAIRGAKISLGVDPLGDAGVHYWAPIADRYGVDLTVVNDAVDLLEHEVIPEYYNRDENGIPTVSAARPSTDYTARAIPFFDGVSVPLETNPILWRQ